MLHSPLLAVALVTGCEHGHPEGPQPAAERTTWNGPAPDIGFGSRLATDGVRVFAGSPFGARVDELAADGTLAAAGTGGGGSYYGAGLLVVEGVPLIGAPGAGELSRNGTIIATEAGLGGVVAAGPGGWVASTRIGWLAGDGSRLEVGHRPDALLDAAGVGVLAGAALGPTSLWRADGWGLPREVPGDGLGFALVECPDAEVDARLILAAPGAGSLTALGLAERIGSLEGRFGAAIACGSTPGTLWVGAPATHEHAGALYRVDAWTTVTRVLTGSPLDELGTAVVVAGGRVFVGAPGPASALGYVLAVPEAELMP